MTEPSSDANSENGELSADEPMPAANRPARWMFADEAELAGYVRQLIKEGAVVPEVADLIGYSPTWVYRFAKRHGIALKPGNRSQSVPTADAQGILKDYDDNKGMTLEEIGAKHGVTAERVRQVAERWGRMSRREERTSELFNLRDVVKDAMEGATSLAQISERTGLTVSQIRRVAEVTLGLNVGDITEKNRSLERSRELSGQSERLRMAMEVAGLSNKQVAQALGIQASRISNIANGKIPGIETFKQELAQICQVDAAWLVSGVNPPAFLRPGVTEASLMAERQAMATRLNEVFLRLKGIVSVGQIAAQCGFAPQQLSLMAKNRTSPRRALTVLARVLDLPEQWLRAGQSEPDWVDWLQAVKQRFE